MLFVSGLADENNFSTFYHIHVNMTGQRDTRKKVGHTFRRRWECHFDMVVSMQKLLNVSPVDAMGFMCDG